MRRWVSRQTSVDVSEQPAASIQQRIFRETSVASQTKRRQIRGNASVVTAMSTRNLILLQSQFRIHLPDSVYLATNYRDCISCHGLKCYVVFLNINILAPLIWLHLPPVTQLVKNFPPFEAIIRFRIIFNTAFYRFLPSVTRIQLTFRRHYFWKCSLILSSIPRLLLPSG
jgi:hypothetical protein